MRIKISEVWNGGTNGSVELAVIEVDPSHPVSDVYDWVNKNRPGLPLNTSINGHGFHAIQI